MPTNTGCLETKTHAKRPVRVKIELVMYL